MSPVNWVAGKLVSTAADAAKSLIPAAGKVTDTAKTAVNLTLNPVGTVASYAASTAAKVADPAGSANTLLRKSESTAPPPMAPPTISSDVAIRIQRAQAGDLTEGGTSDPREAVAYIVGYTTKRYMPGRTQPEREKLAKMLIPWQDAAQAGDAASALSAALRIHAGLLDAFKTHVGQAFAPILIRDALREPAIRVLEHAAGYFTAGGFPGLAARFVQAADTLLEADPGFFAKVAAGIKETVKDGLQDLKTGLSDLASAAGTKKEELVAAVVKAEEKMVDLGKGGLNVAKSVTGAIQDTAVDAWDTVTKEARDLAAAGKGEIEAALNGVREAAKNAATAVGAEKDKWLGKLQIAEDTLAHYLKKVQETGSAMEKKLADGIESGLGRLVAAGESAKEMIAQIPGLARREFSELSGKFRTEMEEYQKKIENLYEKGKDFVGAGKPGDECGWNPICHARKNLSTLAWVVGGLLAAGLAVWLFFMRAQMSVAAKALPLLLKA